MQKLSKELVKKLIYEVLNENEQNELKKNNKISKETVKIIIQEEVRSHYGAE